MDAHTPQSLDSTTSHPPAEDMARLSGLPSEHHHEGAGDAPRRKRGRPNKSQNQASSQASQAQDAVSSSKRTASPLELSQPKRAKRVQDDGEDQIAEEMQQSFSRSQRGDTIHVETQSSATTTTRHNGRRHSELPASLLLDDEDDDVVPELAQSSSGLTPHLNRIGAVKRDFTTMRRVRRSLPAQLGVEPVDEEIDNTHFQYAPLTAVLDGRTRRRLRRSHLSQEVNSYEDHQKKDKKKMLELREQLQAQDAKIKDLEYRLEASRLGNIDVSTPELAQELIEAREELSAMRASSLYNGSDREDSREMSAFDGPADLSDDEGQPMMLVHPGELSLSRDIDVIAESKGRYSQRVEELSSQMTFESLHDVSQLVEDSLIEDHTAIPDKIQDQAVERYEREISQYIRQLAESQGALRVVTLELQNLRFLEHGSSSNDILVELRHGFDNLRLEMERLFPNMTTDLTNQQLLSKVPVLFRGIFAELREKMTALSSSQKTEVLLRRQFEGVLDLLADSEDRVKELEQKEYSLDKSNEQKQRTINDLDAQVATLTELTEGQEARLTDQTTQINGLDSEVKEKSTALERLREASESYRADLESVTLTVTRLETEHEDTIARMEEEHSEQVRTLEEQLAAEEDAREVAEADALQKGDYIEDLDRRIEGLEAEVEQLTEELTQLVERLAQQTEAREEAEEQRDEQAEIANEYATTIDGLNETIVDLRAQITEFQEDLETERAQREKTEAALDDANEKVEELDTAVHNAGIQANELRAKLFELQQEKQQQIEELEKESQEREDALNDQIDTVSEARNAAEKTIEKLSKQIEDLEANLATYDVDLTNMTEARQLLEQDREQQVAVLNQQLNDLRAKYTALENSSNSTIESLQANITDLSNQVQQQQGEIKRLTQTIADQDKLYDQDTTLLKEEIVELKDSLAAERADNGENQKEIASLSRRVESEANELLSMMNSHSKESQALHTTISTLEATIKNHQSNAADFAAEHEATVTTLETEIEDLKLLGTAQVDTITTLQTQIEDLKKRFAKQEQDTRETIDALSLSHRQLLEQNEALAAALKLRNANALEAVMDLKAANVVVKPRDVDLRKVQTGKIVKTTDKVRVGKKGAKKRGVTRGWRDSGIFEDQDDAEDAGVGAEGEEEFLAV